MTPYEWAPILASPPVPRALAIDRIVREVCNTLPIGKEINSNQLIERLYPVVTGEIEEVRARTKINTALMKHREGIPDIAADCRHRGPVRRNHFSGKLIHPWVWHRSTRI